MATPTTRYSYDPRTQRFIDNRSGQPVDPAAIRKAGDRLIDQQTAVARDLADRLMGGQVNLVEWQLQMHDLLKRLHVALGLAAGGGLSFMSAGDLGFLGAHLREQYQYLRDMALQIKRGQQPLNGILRMRAGLFVQAARGTYEQMMRRAASLGNQQEERRVLGLADHCPTCVEQAGLGWQPLGTLNRIGDSECLSNCRCAFAFRTGGEAAEISQLPANLPVAAAGIGATADQLYEALFAGDSRQFGETLNETFKVKVNGTPYFIKSYGEDSYASKIAPLAQEAARLLGVEKYTVPLLSFAHDGEYFEAQPWLSRVKTYDEATDAFHTAVRQMPQRDLTALVLHEFLTGDTDHTVNGGNYLIGKNGSLITSDFEASYGFPTRFPPNLLWQSANEQGCDFDAAALSAILEKEAAYLDLARQAGLTATQIQALSRRFGVLQALAGEEQPTWDLLQELADARLS